jgi:hypothetical protein
MPSYQITTPDGQRFKITAESDDAAQAAISDLLGSAPKQVGFGERGQREQEMPLGPEGEHELEVAQRMARLRPHHGATDLARKGVLQNLQDEAAAGLMATIEAPFRDKTWGEVYEAHKDAENRLAAEYREKNPVTATASEILGSMASPRLFSKAPKGLPGQVGQSMVEGGVYGALGGFGEGDGLEDRLSRAGIGGAIGTAAGVAVPVAGAATGYLATKVGGPAINAAKVLMGKGAEVAEGKVGGALAQDAANGSLRLTDRQVARAHRNGQDVRLLDRGGDVTMALADSADVLAPQARGAMREVAQDRFESQSGRLGDAYGRVAGGKIDDLASEDTLKAAAQKANQANYDAAYKAGNRDLWDDTLSSLMESPAMETALKKAIAKQRNRRATAGRNVRSFTPRVTVDEQSGRILFQKGDVHSYPDLELWDLTKRELDQLATAAKTRGELDDADMYGGLARRLRDHLTELVPQYGKARGVAATMFDAEDALEAGRKLATSADPGASRKLARVWPKMTSAEKALFRQGYAAVRRDQMRNTGKNVNAANKLQNSPEQTTRDKIVLGRRAALLEETKRVEDVMQETKHIFGNSKTAQRLNDMAMAGLGSAAGGYEGGDWQSATLGGLVGLGARRGKQRLDQNVAQHIARILASNDPKEFQRLLALAQRNPQVSQALEGALRSLTRANALATPRLTVGGDSE